MDLKYLGPQIMSLADLMAAANNKQSVVAPRTVAWKEPRPAGFVINLPGLYLFDLIYRRELYIFLPSVPVSIALKREKHWTAHLPAKRNASNG